ncbi:MAG: hypothetical protein Q4C54_08660 [Clostridia bacterium]|nr:hypothetical protein [Clostridia bacterium]
MSSKLRQTTALLLALVLLMAAMPAGAEVKLWRCQYDQTVNFDTKCSECGRKKEYAIINPAQAVISVDLRKRMAYERYDMSYTGRIDSSWEELGLEPVPLHYTKGYTYCKLKDGTIEIYRIDISFGEENCTIPETIDGYKVTAIGDNALE